MTISENEFSYLVKLDEIGAGSSGYDIVADEKARSKLAKRFDLIALDALSGQIALVRMGPNVHATGQMRGHVTQACIATGDPVPAEIDEPVDILFLPEPQNDTDAEIELAPEDCDVMFYDNKVVDIGEAVSQSLGLALNPYPRSAGAGEVLKAAGVKADDEVEIFGELSGLKDLLKGK